MKSRPRFHVRSRLAARRRLQLEQLEARALLATIVVNTTDQEVNSDGDCSLQEAIFAANFNANQAFDSSNNLVTTGCTAGDQSGADADTIVLPDNGVFLESGEFIDQFNPVGNSANPSIRSAIIIEAHGSRLERTGNLNLRAFVVDNATGDADRDCADNNDCQAGEFNEPDENPIGNLTIQNLDIKNFRAQGGNGSEGGGGGLGAGGAIYVRRGSLTVENSTLEGNFAKGGAGSAQTTIAGGGGGGGLGGDGGNDVAFGAGNAGGGGGGARGDGGDGANGGGGGGGTQNSGTDGAGGGPGALGGTGGVRCGGSGGDFTGAINGQPGTCAGGGGGGGGQQQGAGNVGGSGGNGNYGGGGGGGAASSEGNAGSGGSGGFGGGGGSGGPNGNGGNGGFGAGAGAAGPSGGTIGAPGFAGGDASTTTGGAGAGIGGAIFNDSGTVIIRNSTFANNRVEGGASGPGLPAIFPRPGGNAAVFSRNGTLRINDSTFSNNQGTGFNDVWVLGDGGTATFELRNTILANGNGGNRNCVVSTNNDGDVSQSGSGNLIEQVGVVNGDFSPCVGVVTSADPKLAPLALNAPGNTPTMAIPLDSPAVDTADAPTSLAKDQRGVTRPQINGFDIGAYEAMQCDENDALGSNNTQASATILGSLPEITVNRVCINPSTDVDFYKYTAHDTGKLVLNLYFDDGGNLDLRVRDKNGNIIATGVQSVDIPGLNREHIVIPVVTQQQYWLEVFSGAGQINEYDLEIENFAAPVPETVDLDRADDSGRDQLDDVTFRVADVHYFVHADLSEFALEGIPILTAAQAQGGVTPGAAVQVFDNGISVGFATVVSGSDNTLFQLLFNANLTSIGIGGPNAAGPPGYQGFMNFVTAAVRIFDPQKNAQGGAAPATGRTQLSERTDVIQDNIAPLPPTALDLITSSDGGQFNNDNVTLFNALAITGAGEANAHVVLRANGLIVGEGTVGTDATDGVFGNGLGLWEITTEPLTPSLVPYSITATLEDLAGNIGAASAVLFVLIDPAGPQVTNVFITDEPTFNLFGNKPDSPVPTPSVNSLTISLQDLPFRDTLNFPAYLALDPGISAAPGNFLLVGDANGVIPIQQVIVTNDPLVNGQPATASIQLVFAEPLPDDRFTLTILDGVVDPAGNALDGESNAAQPTGAPTFPSGNGLPGGDFVARFTVDSRAEIGAWASGSVYVDTNGNFHFDPTNTDFTNRDIGYLLGFTSDNIFAGNFAAGLADGFDKLAAYGKVGTNFRWLIDDDNDGVPDFSLVQGLFPGVTSVNGMPAAGNFDGAAANGDETVLKVGNTWLIDTDHNFRVDTKLPGTNMVGLPIVGDFDGDGKDDLGAWADNKFSLDLSDVDSVIDGNTDASFTFGFASTRERPVAADFDGDGIDDLGLWVPDRAGVAPHESAEWYLLISDGRTILERLAAGGGVINFTPTPFGADRYAQFGDEFGLPVVGNFDPPLTSLSDSGGQTNLQNPLDANNDGEITPLDALLVINLLNNPSTLSSTNPFSQAPFTDINQDGEVTPLDALLIFNHLNNLPPAIPQAPADGGDQGEGEAAPANADAYFAALADLAAGEPALPRNRLRR